MIMILSWAPGDQERKVLARFHLLVVTSLTEFLNLALGA